MTELQKEYCEEKGLIYIKPQNTEIADYVSWLEAQIQALRIHSVRQQRELLKAFANKFNESSETYILEGEIENFLKAFNCA